MGYNQRLKLSSQASTSEFAGELLRGRIYEDLSHISEWREQPPPAGFTGSGHREPNAEADSRCA